MSAKNDSEFLRLAFMILGALVAFTVIIIIAANMIFSSSDLQSSRDAAIGDSAVENIQPVGEVTVAGQGGEASEAAAAPKSGAEVYQATCLACHGTGVAGAPKVGDAAAWSPRAAAGLDAMMQNALNGKGAMPPKGGNPALSDDEIRAAVKHMLKETGIDAGGQAAAAPVEAAATMASAAVDTMQSAANTVAEAVAPKADPAHGQQVYQASCFACHDTGAAGAPRRGDKTAWAPRIAKGEATLLQHATSGFNAMPPKGGNPALSDEDLAAAVAYMVSQGQ